MFCDKHWFTKWKDENAANTTPPWRGPTRRKAVILLSKFDSSIQFLLDFQLNFISIYGKNIK